MNSLNKFDVLIRELNEKISYYEKRKVMNRKLQIDNISIKILNDYKNRLQNILSEDINTWAKMKEVIEHSQHDEKN